MKDRVQDNSWDAGLSYIFRLFFCISPIFSFWKCSERRGMAPCKMIKETARRMQDSAGKNSKILHPTNYPTPYPSPEIISKHRKFDALVQEMQEIYNKLFLQGERSARPEVAKHRTSLIQSAVLLRQNIGTFYQRSPMFLFSEKGAIKPDVQHGFQKGSASCKHPIITALLPNWGEIGLLRFFRIFWKSYGERVGRCYYQGIRRNCSDGSSCRLPYVHSALQDV